MVQLTPAAARQVVAARQAQGLPETTGLRVFGQPEPGGGLAVGVTFADVPAEDDEVTEQDGARIFVAPEVAEPLSSAAIDVKETAEGAQLVLTQQDPGR